LNDLAAHGLNDLGYEVPAEAAAALGGLLAASDGEGAGTNGKTVSLLQAETLFNYEFGATIRTMFLRRSMKRSPPSAIAFCPSARRLPVQS
jgi:hypothetical protein